MNFEKLMDYIDREHLIGRFMIFLLGIVILAINYNLFLVPNNFVLGGTSGISIILNNAFKINPVIAIYILNLILVCIAFLLLDIKTTRRAVIGSILFPFMISLTEPICTKIIPYIQIDNVLLTVLLSALLFGLGTGLIYRVGFNTGGGDILIKIVNKYFYLSNGLSNFICNGIVLLCGGIVLGIKTVIYSIVILLISSEIVDRIVIGISDSKMFFIYSKKYKEIQKLIIEDLKTGITLFDTEGGYKNEHQEMLMVVVSTKDYYRIKDIILNIDKDAFFVVSDCYEVTGGVKRKNLPFI